MNEIRNTTTTSTTDATAAAVAAQISEWLISTAHVTDGGQTLARLLAERLCVLGIPLWRLSFSLLTKHPEVLWRTVQWHETNGVTVVDRQYKTLRDAYFTHSPVALLIKGTPALWVRLTDADDANRFPICADLRAQGGTDYHARGLRFSNGQISYVSWATRSPGGFSEDALRTLELIAPCMTRRIEIESAYYATQTLLEVYLGRNAAKRVLDGSFHRGGGELIQSAIWFCDLRNFTAMSDHMAPDEVVTMLDTYFDRVAGAITLHGGEVLKFIGDAILAIFPIVGNPSSACRQALQAAQEALSSLDALNNDGNNTGNPLKIGVALHMGEVMYGNIGSRERLDFTVISAAVNETCRLETLCKVLHTPLTMSEVFVTSLERNDIIELGAHELKGVKEPIRVFGLPQYCKPWHGNFSHD